jgi:hypothetical protein
LQAAPRQESNSELKIINLYAKSLARFAVGVFSTHSRPQPRSAPAKTTFIF